LDGDRSAKLTPVVRRFVGFDVLRAAVEAHMPREAHVLVVGNGLSLLAEDLVRAGWRDVCAIDYSDTCTRRMRERASGAAAAEARVSYRTMDVTALQYESGAVTTVLDKATLDTMFNADDEQVAVNRMLDETHRVLAPGGVYVVVSYGEPEDRLPALQQPRFEWTLIDQATLRKNNARFYVYVMLKAAQS
jgi:ubiquinone/menaquinone biosynthesis C-methylase UbiE